ncbi:hypothetical protein [Ralstonia phage RP31]|uniref:Uncharacterized protein n=1 Tax=Ralstonia phage RP31 TaxID=1923890 RepID=A0A1L7N1M3_9CAUD|nr:hypothetical protein [Ralstonia phage RP31]
MLFIEWRQSFNKVIAKGSLGEHQSTKSDTKLASVSITLLPSPTQELLLEGECIWSENLTQLGHGHLPSDIRERIADVRKYVCNQRGAAGTVSDCM